MSTILRAIQKSKLDAPSSPAPIMVSNTQPLGWKIAISAALLIIIALLSTLIYLQLTPRNTVRAVVPEALKTTPVQATAPIIATLSAIEATPVIEKNTITKVNFDTQPIAPLPAPAPQTREPIVIEVPEASAATQQKIVSATANSTPKALTEAQSQNEIAPSDALKARFEMAVLLNEMEENAGTEDELSNPETLRDSTDIHQMSANFQYKVPAIAYQAHMYSSEQQDRWIRINGEDLREGQFDSSGELELLEIQPQRSVFRLQRQSFTLDSLSDWKGY